MHRESQLLRQLGFNCHVEDPQIFLLCFAKFLELDQEMVQCSWDYLLDSMRLSIHCYYPANVVVAACIYMSFRKQNRRMPKCNPPWWDLFDISEGDLIDVCRAIMGLYNGEVLSRYVALPPRPQSVEKGEVKEQEPVRKTARTEGGTTRCVGETRNGKEQERDKDREMQSKGKKKENPIVDPKREMREKPRERDADWDKDQDKDNNKARENGRKARQPDREREREGGRERAGVKDRDAQRCQNIPSDRTTDRQRDRSQGSGLAWVRRAPAPASASACAPATARAPTRIPSQGVHAGHKRNRASMSRSLSPSLGHKRRRRSHDGRAKHVRSA